MPVYNIEKQKDGSTIAIWEITETEDDLLHRCSLPNNELEEMNFISNPQRRIERLAVRLLLEQVLGKKIYLGYHDNGRPYLQNEPGEVSISHTKRFACIIYHPDEHVAIDIESLQRDFAAVEQKALSEHESEYLDNKRRSIQLCLIWCAKEAVYKYICDSRIDFAQQISIAEFMPRKKGKLSATFVSSEAELLEFTLHYRIVDDHALVWLVA